MKDLLCIVFLLVALCCGCERKDSSPNNANGNQKTDGKRSIPSWVNMLTGPPSGMGPQDWDNFVDNLAEEISRDQDHVTVLRNVFATCTKDEAEWAMQAMVKLAEKNPKPEYLELLDLLEARPGIAERLYVMGVYSQYHLSTVSDRFAKILLDENTILGDKLVAIRLLTIMSDSDGCGIIGSDFEELTDSILKEVDTDSFLVLKTLILRRKCDLMSSEDCLAHLNIVLERKGSDFRSEWAQIIRDLCQND